MRSRWLLTGRLHDAEQELAEERARKIPNLGRIRRLEREVRKWERALERWDERNRTRMARLARSSPAPARRSALPAKNAQRAARMREIRFSESDGYGDYVRGQCCIRCGAPPPSQFAHIKGVDLGGTAEDGLPLCGPCHRWQEVNKRQFNAEFEERHGMTPREMSRAMHAAYKLESA